MILHESVREVVRALPECEMKEFVLRTCEVGEQKCVPLLVSHSYDIPDGKNMSAVRHSVEVKRPCV